MSATAQAIDPEWKIISDLVGGDAILQRLCKKIDVRNSDPHGIGRIDCIATWVYSSTDDGWYAHINRDLWSKPSRNVLEFSRLLDRALSKLPKFDGEVYRGYDVLDIDSFMLNYYVGKQICWRGFTSTSLDEDQAFEGNILFNILTKNGRVLGDYADKIAEKEVLITRGTWFEVTHVERDNASAVIWLDEIAQ